MKIHLYIQWFERNEDWSPNYDKEHHGTIEGDTPQDCMKQLQAFRDNHDCSKYTKTEILYIF